MSTNKHWYNTPLSSEQLWIGALICFAIGPFAHILELGVFLFPVFAVIQMMRERKAKRNMEQLNDSLTELLESNLSSETKLKHSAEIIKDSGISPDEMQTIYDNFAHAVKPNTVN
jgi:hypothetical protein